MSPLSTLTSTTLSLLTRAMVTQPQFHCPGWQTTCTSPYHTGYAGQRVGQATPRPDCVPAMLQEDQQVCQEGAGGAGCHINFNQDRLTRNFNCVPSLFFSEQNVTDLLGTPTPQVQQEPVQTDQGADLLGRVLWREELHLECSGAQTQYPNVLNMTNL